MNKKIVNFVNTAVKCSKFQLVGGKPVGYLQDLEELNLEPPNTNRSGGRKRIWTQDLRITNQKDVEGGKKLRDDCFWFLFWLDDIVAHDSLANHVT